MSDSIGVGVQKNLWKNGHDAWVRQRIRDPKGIADTDWVINEDQCPPSKELDAFQKRVQELMPYKEDKNGVKTRLKPREGQLLALYYLCERRMDTILIARTGFGKSLIFQMAPLLYRGVCIIISPLNTLSNEQVENLRYLEVHGAKGLVINAENNSRKTRKEALDEKLTHLITSPEILNSVEFRQEVLEIPAFHDRLMMVALDEMHVGQQWSVFRHKYSELHQFRYRIGTSIPWFGTSATLDPRTLAVSKDAAGFVDPVILRTTIDRPEILYEVREFEVGQKTYEDLRFLIPDKTTFEEAKKLPKVIVYMDTTLEIREAVAKIRASYVQAGLLEWEANRLTCAYFSRMGKRQKKKIAEDFQKEDSTVRIIIATDALGMGVSNRRVELVIQWGVKRIVDDDSAVKTIMQRLGRVARETGEIGHFIWFVPSWVKGIPVIVEATDTSAGSKKTRKPPWTKTDEKNYASMTPFFRELLNPRNCFREILLGFFCEPLRDNTTYPRYPYCCNHLTCQPTYGWESRQSKSPSQRRQEMQEILENFNKQVGVEEDIARKEKILFKLPRNPASAPHGWPHLKGLFQEQLGEWAERKARIRFGKSQYFKPSPQLILPDQVMKTLVQMNNTCTSVKLVRHFNPHWDCDDEDIQEIVDMAADLFILKADGMVKNRELKIKVLAEKQEAQEKEEARVQALTTRYGEGYASRFSKQLGSNKGTSQSAESKSPIKSRWAKPQDSFRDPRYQDDIEQPFKTPRNRTARRKPNIDDWYSDSQFNTDSSKQIEDEQPQCENPIHFGLTVRGPNPTTNKTSNLQTQPHQFQKTEESPLAGCSDPVSPSRRKEKTIEQIPQSLAPLTSSRSGRQLKRSAKAMLIAQDTDRTS